MSARRLLLRDLSARNGWAAMPELDGGELAPNSVAYTLRAMLAQGLVERRRVVRNQPVEWRITQVGVDWLDGRIAFVVRRVKGVRKSKRTPAAIPVATWLASLPRAGARQTA